MKCRFLLLFALLAIVVASCKKVEVPNSKEDILRDGRWQMSEIQVKWRLTDTSFKVDTIKMDKLAECRKDDYLSFSTSNTGIFNSNEKKCAGSVDQTNFRWGITDNDTKMYIYDAHEMFQGHANINANLVEFTDSRFSLEYMEITDDLNEKDPNNPVYEKDTLWFHTIIKKI